MTERSDMSNRPRSETLVDVVRTNTWRCMIKRIESLVEIACVFMSLLTKLRLRKVLYNPFF